MENHQCNSSYQKVQEPSELLRINSCSTKSMLLGAAVIVATLLAVIVSPHRDAGLLQSTGGGMMLRSEDITVRPDGTLALSCNCQKDPPPSPPPSPEPEQQARAVTVQQPPRPMAPPVINDLDKEIPLPPGKKPFTPGNLVFVAGLPRTGSTTLYNFVRVLVRQADPNVIAGFMNWYSKQTLVEWKKLNVSVVLKSHLLRSDLKEMLDQLVFSHRDTVEEVCSVKLWKLMSTESWAQFNRTKEDTIEQTLNLMCRQRSLFVDAQKMGVPVVYDMALAGLKFDPLSVMRKLALALGITGMTRRKLQFLLDEVKGLRPVAVSMLHPVSLLHTGHNMAVHEPELSECKTLVRQQLSEEPDFAEWMSHNGRHMDFKQGDGICSRH